MITKDEKEIIRQHFPSVHIARTMKKRSKRHRYYCEETKSVMRLIDRIRGSYAPNNQRKGENHTNTKTGKRITT